jgi:DNA invertase Pin-like site-specific DNA recombinase
MKIVTYCRVSSDKQGRSGLGLEAQKATIAAYAARHHATIAGAFVEVESGRNNDRPELATALRRSRVTGPKLVIAKLDRLSRDAAFLLNLQAATVDFVACDMPEANALTVGIMAVIAEAESRMIGDRTKAAMAAAKERGRVFGNPNGAAALRRAGKGNQAARQTVSTRADAPAADLVDVLADLRGEGIVSNKAIARRRNTLGKSA